MAVNVISRAAMAPAMVFNSSARINQIYRRLSSKVLFVLARLSSQASNSFHLLFLSRLRCRKFCSAFSAASTGHSAGGRLLSAAALGRLIYDLTSDWLLDV